MTPAEFKAARNKLGMSVTECADFLLCEPRTVRRWEDGTRDIPRYAEHVMTMKAAGREAFAL